MKKTLLTLIGFSTVALLFGCVADAKRPSLALATAGANDPHATEVRTDRMLVWTASLRIQVRDIGDAAARATAMTERQGGFVEQKSDRGADSASLTLRIPAETFPAALSELESLGTVTNRTVQAEDVTERSIDIEARLKNKIALRDRLKQLLDKATGVQDILAIETELNRVQTDIDAMEGRMRSLQGRVDYATIRLTLERKRLLGPLGYLFKGLFWGVEKLFVIR